MKSKIDDLLLKRMYGVQDPEKYEQCNHCNGYGSSLKESNPKCTKCNGKGFVRISN